MTKPILFISDLHLTSSSPEMVELFLSFLRKQAIQAQALYLLGDFFEIWIGDDDINPWSQQIITALASVTAQGVPIYFMHGNRDFLIGKRFAALTGCQLLNDPYKIDLFGKPTLLMHGDLLCTDDQAYQRFRKWVHHPCFQKIYLSLPLPVRRWLAVKARQGSKKHVKSIEPQIMDVNPNTVEKIMAQYGVEQLIHGHTHRPHLHHFTLNQKPVTRAVLGAWHTHGSVLYAMPNEPFKLLVIEKDNFSE